jgi:hypothetical protein
MALAVVVISRRPVGLAPIRTISRGIAAACWSIGIEWSRVHSALIADADMLAIVQPIVGGRGGLVSVERYLWEAYVRAVTTRTIVRGAVSVVLYGNANVGALSARFVLVVSRVAKLLSHFLFLLNFRLPQPSFLQGPTLATA